MFLLNRIAQAFELGATCLDLGRGNATLSIVPEWACLGHVTHHGDDALAVTRLNIGVLAMHGQYGFISHQAAGCSLCGQPSSPSNPSSCLSHDSASTPGPYPNTSWYIISNSEDLTACEIFSGAGWVAQSYRELGARAPESQTCTGLKHVAIWSP